MDLYFESYRRPPFCIEVGYWDTVLEIKQKVQKYHAIPAARQILMFRGKVLENERNIEQCVLLHNSRLQLLITPDPETRPSTKKIVLRVRIPTLRLPIPFEMDVNDTVGHLKGRIERLHNISIICLVHHATSIALNEDLRLWDYGITTTDQEIDVILAPPPPKPAPKSSRTHAGTSATRTSTAGTSAARTYAAKSSAGTSTAGTSAGTPAAGTSSETSATKLKLMVQPIHGVGRIPVEVNATDNVRELRNELQKLQSILNLYLPSEGYFFIYKQNVMDDDRTFQWHKVNDGDTIEFFGGNILNKFGNVLNKFGTPAAGTSAETSAAKLKLMVQPMHGDGTIPVEVNATDNVRELRIELQKLQPILNLYLPPKGYFFIYKQNVMNDDRTFQWHKVNDGDTIEFFSGNVKFGF